MPLGPDMPPPISPLVLRFFRRVVRRYFRRHFRTVLALHAHRLRGHKGPLIVYGNHASWWDPMLIILLGQLLLPDSRHYAPIDARALQQYPILRKLGIFPVEMASPRGAAQFLRTAQAILDDGGVLWMTPQGRFADPREFPLAFKPGLGALALRMPQVPLVPLAVEYAFWDERLPEVLLQFGEAVHLPVNAATSQATRELEAALAASMFALQRSAIQRDPALFETLFAGGRGTGGAYAVIRNARAFLQGKQAAVDHTDRNGL